MDRIIFEFSGGPHHGKRIEGGANRSWSAIKQDHALRLWFLTRCGSRGEQLRLDDEIYEVADRVFRDGATQVMTTWVPAVRNQENGGDSVSQLLSRASTVQGTVQL